MARQCRRPASTPAFYFFGFFRPFRICYNRRMTNRRKRRTPQAAQDQAPSQNGASLNGELMPASPKRLTPQDRNELVSQKMTEQHPIYGAFAYAFEELGGVDALTDWAEQNPTDFYRIFSRMVPKESGGATTIAIQVNNQLGPTALDT